MTFGWLAVVILGGLLLAVGGHPFQNQPQNVQQLAEEYSRLHPNKDPDYVSPEYSGMSEGRPGRAITRALPPPPKQNVTNLWEAGVVYYEFEEDIFADWQVENVEGAMTELTDTLRNDDGTPCVQFVPWTGQSDDYITINNYAGCRSHIIGRAGGRQELSLAISCVLRRGVIMHELLHTLGFQHEQKRLDRDSYVTVNWDNIKEERKFNFESSTEQYTGYDVSLPYDYGSILHYAPYSFAIDRSIPTIIPTDPDAEIGQRVRLSDLDILKVHLVYGCNQQLQEESSEDTYWGEWRKRRQN